jgi:hypothetical protein
MESIWERKSARIRIEDGLEAGDRQIYFAEWKVGAVFHCLQITYFIARVANFLGTGKAMEGVRRIIRINIANGMLSISRSFLFPNTNTSSSKRYNFYIKDLIFS